MSKKLLIETHGCQMNVYDSEKMGNLLSDFGYITTENEEEADAILINTCHIREKAAEKLYSRLGRIKQLKESKIKRGHGLIIIVAGCVAQAEGDEVFRRAPYVDIIVGPQSYHTLPNLLERLYNSEKHLISLDFVEEQKFDNLPVSGTFGASSFVSVQEGCDKFCTFCVVPYTRGSEFSRKLEQVYREVMKSVSNGAKEIIFLGQNVNAYHGITPENTVANLADLIRYVSDIKGLERIRYITSHPIDMTDDLIPLHGSEPKLMPFLHLPVQSGSNKILKLMNRKHDREYYFDIINKVRAARPDIALSSDFIVGFPEETDEDFADTLDLVKKVQYAQCFSFKYSPRPGTPAAVRHQVPEQVKSERLAILQKELFEQQMMFNKSFEGKSLPVLFDIKGKNDIQLVGKTPYMQSVYLEGQINEDLSGKILNLEIIRAGQVNLTAIFKSI